MSKSFANKVVAERLVLKNVNAYTLGAFQLTGLTNNSISSWANLHCLEKNSVIELTLKEISELCHRMSDRSKEAFESIDDRYLEDIALKIPTLLELLKDKFGH
jgi:hypothetical protein